MNLIEEDTILNIEKPRISITLGTIFGIIACAIMVIQMTVQGTVMVKLSRMFAGAGDETQRRMIVFLYRGLRYIDQGIDLAFDRFLFSAWILLGFAMLKHRSFGKVLGAIGIIAFSITAILNIWTAPAPPQFEMAPFVALWGLAVYIQMLRSVKSLPLQSDLAGNLPKRES